MNDKELADAVVALGVGGSISDGTYRLSLADIESRTAEQFVRDWRVAGALVEITGWCQALLHPDGYWMVNVGTDNEREGSSENESAPRAIIEACVEALGAK